MPIPALTIDNIDAQVADVTVLSPGDGSGTDKNAKPEGTNLQTEILRHGLSTIDMGKDALFGEVGKDVLLKAQGEAK